MKQWFKLVVMLIGCCNTIPSVFSQCQTYPVPLQQRVTEAEYIVLGRVVGTETFPDPVKGTIQTLNKLEVTAWLKNQQQTREVYVITLGGIYGNRATRAWPSLHLRKGQEYLLFLDKQTFQTDNKAVRRQQPDALQVTAYAGVQGALPYQHGLYIDLMAEKPMDEAAMFARVQAITRQDIVTPGQQRFEARRYESPNPGARVQAVAGFTPTTTHAGTIEPGDFLTITGSGFGNTKGTVEFSDADNGGSSFITPPTASDYVSWTDNTIVVKVPDFAGSGKFRVNGMESPGDLTITYAHFSATDNFGGWPELTRQRIHHRNINGQGGYTFLFNTDFNNNANAVACFQRAISQWRCATGVNFSTGGATSINDYDDDDVSVVFFDSTLNAGTLAQTVANYTASWTSSCKLEKTVWWFTDMDVRVRPKPTVSHNWNFTTNPPTTSQYDFESIALHELGHAHGLGHVILPGAVMHYSIPNGQMARFLSANDITGASAKMLYSTEKTCFNPDNSGGPMVPAAVSGCAASGVTFLSFDGVRLNNTTTHLTWTTQNEVTSRGFYVQRSTDNVLFNTIDFVATKAPGAQPLSYEYDDDDAGPGNLFYRLQQWDANAAQKISDTVHISGDEASAWVAWGNLSSNTVQVRGPSSASVQVFSTNGQLVYRGIVNSGTNTIGIRMPLGAVYFVRIITPTATFTKKVMLGVIR